MALQGSQSASLLGVCALWLIRCWQAVKSLRLFRARPVDDLCETTPLLCAGGEMLGIPLPGHAHNRIVSWQNAIHTLCIAKNLICLCATPGRLINKSNVYRKYI